MAAVLRGVGVHQCRTCLFPIIGKTLPSRSASSTDWSHEGLNVWLDMELKAGENYDEITEERLRGAKAVVVLWSSRSVKSRWVRAEATIGQRKSTLVPAMIEECDRPVMFELVQTTDLSKWEGDRADPTGASWST